MKKLSSTLENYLEAIYRIENEKRAARVRDISRRLDVAKSTVNAALKSLGEKGLVDYTPYELILLTPEGREAAAKVVVNHEIIRDFLQNVLLLERERAERIACEMEHAVDRDAIKRFACFIAFMQTRGTEESRSIDTFRSFLEEAEHEGRCRNWAQEYLDSVRAGTDSG